MDGLDQNVNHINYIALENSNPSLNITFTFFQQGNQGLKLKFDGNLKNRTVVALLLISGQTNPVPPICISFYESGYALISSNDFGIVGEINNTVSIPKGVAGDWGVVNVMCLYKGLLVESVA